MIVVDHVSKTYQGKVGEVHALTDVSLQIESGEIFGILGRSGAGKTTLMRCLNRLETPTSGTITIDGVNYADLTASELRGARRQIGMVFQHFNLLSARTVAGNISYPLEIAGVPKAERDARVAELLDLVGLGDRAKAFPSELSGGQKQRVGIARALATRPSVLLCDEATSALDPATTEQILDLIADINAKTGVTVVLITHESEVVRRICHSAVLMEDGRVAEQGKLLDLMADPTSKLADILMPISGPADADGTVLTMSFAHDDADRPLLTSMARDLGVDVSILGGSIETMAQHKVGRLRVALTNDDEHNIDPALVESYLSQHDVAVTR